MLTITIKHRSTGGIRRNGQACLPPFLRVHPQSFLARYWILALSCKLEFASALILSKTASLPRIQAPSLDFAARHKLGDSAVSPEFASLPLIVQGSP